MHDKLVVIWNMHAAKNKYLLTSYVSTKAINPSGNAIANDTIAASSPSLDSSSDTSSNPDNCLRYPTAKSSRFFTVPTENIYRFKSFR